MKKPILTLADDQTKVYKGQMLVNKKTGHHFTTSTESNYDLQGEYDIYDVEFIEETPESEKIKQVVSDEEILAKANDFYKRPPNKYPGPTYTDLDLSKEEL